MKDFSTELLREKFTLIAPQTEFGAAPTTLIALSNRIVVPLHDHTGKHIETFIVRAHNMHSAVRMAARIIHDFNHRGSLTKRKNFDWNDIWHSILNDYEHTYNPQCWIAIYHAGKCIFRAGELHLLLDIIEKCDQDNDKDYDFSIPLAEKLFQQAGKSFKIKHEANIALSVQFEGNKGRCGVILRSPSRTTIFTFLVEPKDTKGINIPQCLGACAAFLEGIQLGFLVGMNTEKIKLGLIERFSKEDKQTKEGRKRLTRLGNEIDILEKSFKIHYRPEKPVFYHIVMDAEKRGQNTLTAHDNDEEDETGHDRYDEERS